MSHRNKPLANDRNPFSASDADRRQIWDILMRRDFEGFLAGDWSLVGPDFLTDVFCGVDARKQANPDAWRITFPTVEHYRDEWLRQVDAFKPIQLAEITKIEFLYSAARLDDIEIAGNRALAHKKFDGSTKTTEGETITLCWQSLFQMLRVDGQWKIAGFVGYMPNP